MELRKKRTLKQKFYRFLLKHFPNLADKMFWHEFNKSKKRLSKFIDK